jgi:hypothetical protein
LLSYSVARQQQYIAMFDQSAIQPVAIEQRDLLSRIKNFFRLSVEDRALTSMAESSPVSGRRFCRLPADDS